MNSVKKAGLDPRTKLLLLLFIAVFVLGGAGSEELRPLYYGVSVIPAVLFLLDGNYKKALFGLVSISLADGLAVIFMGKVQGIPGFLLLFVTGIWSRMLPGILMGQYTLETTKVSEFIAAFENMHVPVQLTIPISVMFRFFPTVLEEFRSINAAMRMRDIVWGKGSVMKAVEYRIVPMLNCSAVIGEELSAAALSRGLNTEIKRTNICRIGFGMVDLVFLSVCLLCLIGEVFVRVMEWGIL